MRHRVIRHSSLIGVGRMRVRRATRGGNLVFEGCLGGRVVTTGRTREAAIQSLLRYAYLHFPE